MKSSAPFTAPVTAAVTAPVGGGIQVIDRMAELLEAITRADRPATLKVLAAETGLHPSTAHRILASAIKHGWVERAAEGRYRLGITLLRLASRVREHKDIRREALPIMEWLRGEVGETVNLTLREGDEVVYVERVSSHKTIRVEQVIGGRAPLHVTAAGKLFLGCAGKPAFDLYTKRTGLPAYTTHTLTSTRSLWKNISQSVERGCALDNEEAERGVGCIAAPVRDAVARMVAGLSISAPIERRRDLWIPILIEAARRLSERLGYVEVE